MNRIDARLDALKTEGRAALIPFMTCGDPPGIEPAELMHAAVSAGADLIELGMPFSDPMADGPVIQAASERALAHGMTLSGVLETVSQFRQGDQNTPVILMGYLNPIERMGHQAFIKRAAEAGVDGVLLVDLPVEEDADFRAELTGAGIHPIMLVAPTTHESRRQRILEAAGGFVYYIRVKGITGSRESDSGRAEAVLDSLRSVSPVPVAVGFGIRGAEDAAALARHADAVVIGSALVDRLAQSGEPRKALSEFLSPIRKALESLG